MQQVTIHHFNARRQASASVITHVDGAKKALPVIEDGIVPPEKFAVYLTAVYKLFQRHGLRVALWGHAGDGNLHMQPYLDLAQVGDRQKMLKLMDEYYDLVISLGGSTSGQHGDGRLRTPYLSKLYGQDAVDLFVKTKKIFDPYNIFNPGVKTGTTTEDLKQMLRTTYNLDHLYQHLPRS